MLLPGTGDGRSLSPEPTHRALTTPCETGSGAVAPIKLCLPSESTVAGLPYGAYSYADEFEGGISMSESSLSPESGPDAALLLYFIGDQAAPAHGHLRQHVPIPGREAKANKADLAQLLFAASFWDLREGGAIGLAIVQQDHLGGKSTRVQVTLERQVPCVGLESDLLAQLVKDPNHQTVHRLVESWYHSSETNPAGKVIVTVRQEGQRLGYFAGRVRAQPIPAAIAPRLPEAEKLLESWHAFCAAERALADQLLQDCATGMRSEVVGAAVGGVIGGMVIGAIQNM